LQDIDVIERTWETKETMPNPQILWCYRLKHNCWIMALPGVLSVPCVGKFFPFSMHTIYATKHAGPTSFFVHRHQPLCILFTRILKIRRTKQADDHLSKYTNTLKSSIFTKSKVLIGVVCANAICNHPHGCWDLLVRPKTEKAGGIPLASKKMTIGLTSFNYHHK
jgi:hypothetical protein